MRWITVRCTTNTPGERCSRCGFVYLGNPYCLRQVAETEEQHAPTH